MKNRRHDREHPEGNLGVCLFWYTFKMSDGVFYGLVFGIVLGAGVFEFVPWSPFLVGVVMVLGVLLLLVYLKKKWLVTAVCMSVLFGVSLVGVRGLSLVPVTTPVLDQLVGSEVSFVGTVVHEPEFTATNQRLYIENEATKILVYVDRFLEVAYGDTVSVTGKLVYPEAFVSDTGRTFAYPGYLRAKGVGYLMYYPEVLVEESATGWSLVGSLLTLKQVVVNRLSQFLPMPEAGLAAGILLGVTVSLGDALEQAFRDSGIIHIVVLSGYNMMLVVSFFLFVLAYVLPYRARLLVGLCGVWLFALLVGLSATVTRAAIMASLLLLVRFGGQTHSVMRALFLAGAVMLLSNPYLLLYDIGFQLSFMATLALLLLSEPLARVFAFVPAVGGVREFLVATLATQFFVSPLLLYHMGAFSLVSVVVNVLVLPVVPLAMAAAALLALIGSVPGVGTLWMYVTYWLLHYIMSMATWFAALPLATVTVPAFSGWVVLGGYAGMALMWFSVRFGYRWYSTRYRERPLRAWVIVEEQ